MKQRWRKLRRPWRRRKRDWNSPRLICNAPNLCGGQEISPASCSTNACRRLRLPGRNRGKLKPRKIAPNSISNLRDQVAHFRTIVSPAGFVGNLVNANDTILTNIVSTDPINFYFDIDERSYLAYEKMSAGGVRMSSADLATRCSSRPPARMNRLTKATSISQTTDLMRKAGHCVVGRLYPIRIRRYGPASSAAFEILGTEKYRGVLVPEEAIGSDQDRRVVLCRWVGQRRDAEAGANGISCGRLSRRPDWLTGDETIVVNGLMRVRPGVKVEPKVTTLPPTRSAPQN